jgi:hypothetical protein
VKPLEGQDDIKPIDSRRVSIQEPGEANTGPEARGDPILAAIVRGKVDAVRPSKDRHHHYKAFAPPVSLEGHCSGFEYFLDHRVSAILS